ncbi:MAG: hypothetical protein V1753_08295, partial [Pseudomonadota bacterium]
MKIAFYLCSIMLAVIFSVQGAFAGVETSIDLSMGYRVDSLEWNIAGDIYGQNPNILSELTWDNLKSYQVKCAGTAFWDTGYGVKGYLAHGWILDGNNQDSDYDDDYRTDEFSRSNNASDDGSVDDKSVGVGYKLWWTRANCSLIPLIGYSQHNQDFSMTDGNQTIPPTGPFDGLESSYKAEWKGPWIGFDLSMAESKQVIGNFSIEYHSVSYYGEADWNLREDFRHPI